MSDHTPNADVFIYALVDPRDQNIRYIGKSTNVDRRLRRHLKDARDGKTDHKSRWLAALIRTGLKPIIRILEQCDKSVWKARECHWIAALRQVYDLTNAKGGGDGYEPDNLTREKMRQAKLGKGEAIASRKATLGAAHGGRKTGGH